MRTTRPLDKIEDLEKLARWVSDKKERGLRVAQCHGVFDLIHPGHIRHLQAASRLADFLVVTVTPDGFVGKGPGRPAFNQRLRLESLAALASVDKVALARGRTAVETIRLLKPSVFIKGKDASRSPESPLLDEAKAAESVGASVQFTDEITFSATKLLNQFFPVFAPETDAYLREFRKTHNAEEIIKMLKELKDLKVIVLGDIIIDEYHFCKSMGKASKSPTLTARFLSEERHAGGSLAVANHAACHSSQVLLLTYQGQSQCEAEFIAQSLKPNVETRLVPKNSHKNIVKRRYVEPFQVNKMFEVQWLEDQGPDEQSETMILDELEAALPEYDLVIVADFGHGAVSQRTIEMLCERAQFLCINTQTNSANLGYNLITKYPRCDYLCIDEEEMRLANHDRRSCLSELTRQTAHKMGARLATVTRGNRGSVTWSRQEGCIQTPIFSADVVDSVGAGDAYLSVAALCARAQLPVAVIGFVGNCTGALAVRTIGNREPVEASTLFRYIETLLR